MAQHTSNGPGRLVRVSIATPAVPAAESVHGICVILPLGENRQLHPCDRFHALFSVMHRFPLGNRLALVII